MTKADLRKYYLNKRKEYTAEELQLKSLQISMHFFTHFNLDKIQYLHLFLPISKQNEIDTWPIIQRILKNYPSVNVVIPKSDRETLTMENYCLDEDTTLQINTWGIWEPAGGKKIEVSKIDMVIIPLLAFDERGYRVGYGKGFYDRFLEGCRKDAIKIGLSYEQPVPVIEDTNQYDVKMNYCITPEKIWTFNL